MKFRRLSDLEKAKAVIAKLRALKYFPGVPAADFRGAYGELSGGEELKAKDEAYKEIKRLLKQEKRKISRQKDPRRLEQLAASDEAAKQ